MPEMCTKDLELPVFSDKKQYDPIDHVKVRVVAKEDWGRVDWETMKVKDEQAQPVHFDKVIFNIHGGSWNGGSSGERYMFLKSYAIRIGCPVFSVDYRLAPSHMFPEGLDDCFQVYMWLVYYSRKYLQITFDKIILDGDSAGGNLSLSLSVLTILRNIRIPDKLILHYPCASIDIKSFTPSLVTSVDDSVLPHHFLPNVINFYAEPKNKKHQLSSPKYMSQEVLEKFPKCYFLIAEMDPIRDEALRTCLRLAKVGKQLQEDKVEVIIFKHCQHSFTGHSYYPKLFEMSKTAKEMAEKIVLE